MKVTELLTEIERIAQSQYRGGKDELKPRPLQRKVSPKEYKKLPGGAGFYYSVTKSSYGIVIKIWDPAKKEHDSKFGTVIGKLSLGSQPKNFPMKNVYEVETITVDEDYRGQNLAKSLYGIALSILKVKLLAGDFQTPGGRKNWVSLSKIPGVEVVGWVKIEESDDISQKDLEELIGSAGAFSIGSSRSGWGYKNHFLLFDVKQGSDGKEMVEKVKTKLSRVYSNSSNYDVGLMAHWVG